MYKLDIPIIAEFSYNIWEEVKEALADCLINYDILESSLGGLVKIRITGAKEEDDIYQVGLRINYIANNYIDKPREN
jgi:hypothetical protein